MNSQFIPVLLDADEQAAVVQKLGVDSFPTVLVISPENKIVGRFTGFQTAPQLQSRLAAFRPRVVTQPPLLADLTPRPPAFPAPAAQLLPASGAPEAPYPQPPESNPREVQLAAEEPRPHPPETEPRRGASAVPTACLGRHPSRPPADDAGGGRRIQHEPQMNRNEREYGTLFRSPPFVLFAFIRVHLRPCLAAERLRHRITRLARPTSTLGIPRSVRAAGKCRNVVRERSGTVTSSPRTPSRSFLQSDRRRRPRRPIRRQTIWSSTDRLHRYGRSGR